MNIIFLDVDGVLNSKAYFDQNKDRGHADINDYNLQILAEIYHTNSAKSCFLQAGESSITNQIFTFIGCMNIS